MPPSPPVYRLVELHGPADRVVLRNDEGACSRLIVLSGYAGPAMPATLTGPVIDEGAGRQWRLRAAEGAFEFRARTVERIEEHPALYQPLHRAFALSATDRAALRLLLVLLRLPGGPRLLRFWHARRS
ncbi:MAG TPA: hypothetical protein VFR29_03715 [Steroidobacteraceae bacterium]|nr:hypothetical protein [Steroidobacteraceae bacterium]